MGGVGGMGGMGGLQTVFELFAEVDRGAGAVEGSAVDAGFAGESLDAAPAALAARPNRAVYDVPRRVSASRASPRSQACAVSVS